MSAATPSDDGSFAAASHDGADAAGRQRWLVTKQDHGSFNGRGQRAEAELQRLTHPPLRMWVAHPENRVYGGRRGREPRWHDRDDGIEAGAGGTREDVLQ